MWKWWKRKNLESKDIKYKEIKITSTAATKTTTTIIIIMINQRNLNDVNEAKNCICSNSSCKIKIQCLNHRQCWKKTALYFSKIISHCSPKKFWLHSPPNKQKKNK